MKVEWTNMSTSDGPEHSAGLLLWQASMMWRRRVEAALSESGLTHPQYMLLSSLSELTAEGAAVNQIELARHCQMDVATTSQILRTLERKGLVERRRQRGDERAKYPALTKTGRAVVAEASPCVEAADAAFFGSLGARLGDFSCELSSLIGPERKKTAVRQADGWGRV